MTYLLTRNIKHGLERRVRVHFMTVSFFFVEQKDLEVRPSSTGIEPSSAGSCESVYGNSTSKVS